MKKKILGVLVLISIIGCMLTSCGHEHEFGNWKTSKKPTCTEKGIEIRTCECGEEDTRTIDALGHSFIDATCTSPKICSKCNETEGSPLGHSNDNGICTVCNYVDPSEKERQLATAASIAENLKSLEALCDTMSDVYKDAWYFYVYKSDDYYSYSSILSAISNYTGVPSSYINDATIAYLEYLNLDTTQSYGTAALRTLDGTLVIMQLALDSMGFQDACETLLTTIENDYSTLNGKVIGTDYLAALTDYYVAVSSYYEFAEVATGNYNSYNDNLSVYRNTCASKRTALSIAKK